MQRAESGRGAIQGKLQSRFRTDRPQHFANVLPENIAERDGVTAVTIDRKKSSDDHRSERQ